MNDKKVRFPFCLWDPFGIKRRYSYRFSTHLLKSVQELLAEYAKICPYESFAFYDSYDNDMDVKFCTSEIDILPICIIKKSETTEKFVNNLIHNIKTVVDRLLEEENDGHLNVERFNETFGIFIDERIKDNEIFSVIFIGFVY